jgi:hypothetical protein
MADQNDYTETYDEFWREIVENNDRALNRDQIMRELHDYRVLLEEVPKVYDEVTGGRLSKPNTAACHVIDAVTERVDAAITDALQEAAQDLLDEGAHDDRCSQGPPGTCDCALGVHYRWLIARAKG